MIADLINCLSCNSAMQGNEIFAYIDAVANAKLEDINARLAEMLDVDNCTLSVVKQPDEV